MQKQNLSQTWFPIVEFQYFKRWCQLKSATNITLEIRGTKRRDTILYYKKDAYRNNSDQHIQPNQKRLPFSVDTYLFWDQAVKVGE